MKEECFESRFYAKESSCKKESSPRMWRPAGFENLQLHSGFTLIELLVVVLIIGILAAIALPQYQKAVLRSRFGAMKHLVGALVNAEKFYYLTYGTYTVEMDALGFELSEKPYKIEKEIGIESFEKQYFSWGQCRVMQLPEGKLLVPNLRMSCEIEHGQNARVTYAIWFYFPPGEEPYTRVHCIAYDHKNKVGQELCKKETGKSTENYVDSVEWYHYLY